MRRDVQYQLWIVAAASLVFFVNLGVPALFDMDEALYATCAREMFQGHDWVVPMFNGELFPEKPPLMFWTMIGGFELFGVNEWGARFFSAVMGVGTALVAFHLGRLLFNSRVGLWAGLVTASTIIFTVSARAATVDSALTFVTALAFLMFVLGWRKGGRFPLQYAIAAYACIGLAVLGKGPVGMVLPLAAMGLFLLVIDGWRKLLTSAWWMRPLTAIAVIAAVAAPWYVWVGVATHGEWPRRFFIDFNLRPFKQPILGHGDVSSIDRVKAALVSILYYFYQIPAILVGFFPWSVFLGPTLVETIRRIRGDDERSDVPSATAGLPSSAAKRTQGNTAGQASSGTRAFGISSRTGCILAACWFATWFVFWSVCKTKLPHYLLPAYPALALLTACFIERWLAEPASLPRWALRNAWLSTIVVGVGFLAVIPFVAAKFLPGQEWLGLVGLPLVVGGAWCWREATRGRAWPAAVGFAATSVVFLTVMFGFGVVAVDKYQNAKPMMAAIAADWNDAKAAPPIATYQFFRESTVYYAGRPVARCDERLAPDVTARQMLAKFFAPPRRSYVITTDEHEAEIQKAFPGKVHEIFRQPQFLGDDQMVVLRHDAGV